MKKYLPFLFSLLGLMLALFGCGEKVNFSSSDRAEPNQSIRLNISSEPQTLDPRKVRFLSDINLVRMLNEGLTRVDKEGKASLALAKNVEVSENGLTYRFTLRDSTWSNGDLLTSRDFAYAWKKSLQPAFNSPNAHMLYVIKNAKKIKTGQLPVSLIGIDTPDDKTLIVHLEHKTPYFLELTEHPIFFPVNEGLDRFDPKWSGERETHLSNGPFKIAEWKHNDFIEAVKNPSYWDAKTVKIDTLSMYMVSGETGFQMFGAKELDWDGSPFSVIPIDAIETLRQTSQLESAPVLATQWVGINIDQPPFQSKKLRHALALAINRRDIVDHVTQGSQIPATGIVPKAMGLQDHPYFEDGQIEHAVHLFEEALLELGLTRESLPEITLAYPMEGRAHAVCQALQHQWLVALGIHVQLKSIEKKAYFSGIANRDYMLSLRSWFADFNDPINFLEVFQSKSHGTNDTNWENPKYEELLETSYACKSPEERLRCLKQSEQLIMDEMPVIPIYYYNLLFVKDHALKNVVINRTGSIDFKWAELNRQHL